MSVFNTEHRSESLPARIAFTFLESASAACEEQVRAARGEGLPTLQASILVRVLSRPDRESTVGELAAALHLTPPTISDSLKALLGKGLVKRRRSPEDGRVVFFGLTRKGRETAQRIGCWGDQFEQSIRRLDPDKQVALMGCLTRLLRSQVEEGYLLPESMCASCVYLESRSVSPDVWACAINGGEFDNSLLSTGCLKHVPLQSSG
ncbi:MarR family winged helix-turn-helix transcriptional regulator [Gemmatimonadota bacterium]